MTVKALVLTSLFTLGAAFGPVPAAAVGDGGTGGGLLSDPPPLRLVLNVPASRLYVYESGEMTRTYRISVGEPGYETPKGQYRVSEIIWNPWWHPPNSEWARGREVEPPGPDNPMGRVKMFFAPLLYIHGSPEVGMIGRPASKGCVRMLNEEVIELARLIHTYTTPTVGESTLEQLRENEKQTRTFNLSRGVPFEVIYQVAEVRDGNFVIYPDVYGRAQGRKFEDQVRAVLAEAGIDFARVNREHYERLISKGRTAIVSIAVEELVQPAAGAPGATLEGGR
jgi:murein L,D-transpeptidase YcbB/YkuD